MKTKNILCFLSKINENENLKEKYGYKETVATSSSTQEPMQKKDRLGKICWGERVLKTG